MVCLRFKPGAAGWKAQKNPLSYGGPTYFTLFPLPLFLWLEFALKYWANIHVKSFKGASKINSILNQSHPPNQHDSSKNFQIAFNGRVGRGLGSGQHARLLLSGPKF